jgi:hypothetical protein
MATNDRQYHVESTVSNNQSFTPSDRRAAHKDSRRPFKGRHVSGVSKYHFRAVERGIVSSVPVKQPRYGLFTPNAELSPGVRNPVRLLPVKSHRTRPTIAELRTIQCMVNRNRNLLAELAGSKDKSIRRVIRRKISRLAA